MRPYAHIIVGLLLSAQSLLAHAGYQAEFIETSKAWGSVVADFNNDGHDDIFITGHDEDDRIWYWSPDGYVPSKQVFDWVDRHDCDAADFNLDGRLDLYCAVGADHGTAMKANELWLQGSDGVFTQMAGHGAEDPYGRSRYVLFFDMNHDGYPDIFTTSYPPKRDDGQPNINHVYLNQAGKGFREADTVATGPFGCQCIAKGDINQDGWDDVVVCKKGMGHLYLNKQTNDFVDLAPPALGNRQWTDAKLVDMNEDGRDDLVLITADNDLEIWFNTGHGQYFDHPGFQRKLPAIGESLAISDLDGDGRKDIYVVLRDQACKTTLSDLASDLLYRGQGGNTWGLARMSEQKFAGCGHLAAPVDGNKILLMNGGIEYRGPNYVLSAGR